MTTPICPDCGSVAVSKEGKKYRCGKCGFLAKRAKFTEHMGKPTRGTNSHWRRRGLGNMDDWDGTYDG